MAIDPNAKMINDIDEKLKTAQILYNDNNLLNKIDLCEARLILIKANFLFEYQSLEV